MSTPSNEQVTADAVTFYSVTDGSPYTTADPGEITRMRMSRNFSESKNIPAVIDQTFHPDDHDVKAVQQYLAENPAQVDRIIAEERLGQRRKSITGDS